MHGLKATGISFLSLASIAIAQEASNAPGRAGTTGGEALRPTNTFAPIIGRRHGPGWVYDGTGWVNVGAGSVSKATAPVSKATASVSETTGPVNGALTISITNSFGPDLSISYGHAADGPTALSQPTPGPLGDNTQIIYPSGWAGRINIGKDFNTYGSKIEASFSPPMYQPHVDVSYVDGYTLPITCSCAGVVITGCNVDLFSHGQCANQGPGPICFNPLSNSKQVSGTPASEFFDPCQGAAYTYPFDDRSDVGCNSNLISCCVGSDCPAPARQHGKRSLEESDETVAA